MAHRNDLNVVELLSDLAAREITLWVEGDQLRYRAPKAALTPQIVTTLRQHKAELIAWLQERDAVATDGQGGYPLTQGQLGLWLEWQLDPRSTRYHLVSVDRLPADVCLDTLRHATQMLLDRHSVLRTAYPLPADPAAIQPVQQVQAGAVVAFTVVDGTTWTQAHVTAWIAQTADLPFDLSSGPVMRIAVLRTVDDQGQVAHLLHWSIHHIATDYVSQEILRHDLADCYAALRQGTQPPPIDALSYHDFVRWEQDTLQAQGEQLAAFWQNYLSGEVPLLDLPRAPTAHQADSATTGRHSFALDPQLVAQLRALARVNQTTLYPVLLAAYEVLLHRYSQQERFLITSPTAVRTLPGWSSTVGYFVNPLVLRAELAGNPAFSTLLQQIQQSYQQVLQHQLYPYPEMLRQLQKQVSQEQLQQAIAGFVFVALSRAQDKEALFAPISSEQRGMPQALTLTIFDVAGDLTGMFTYDAARFDSAMIERMVGHLQTLLSGIVANPAQPVGLLPLLTANERHQLLVEWNNTATDYPHDYCIHQLFEAQVERTPAAIALVFEQQQLSYRDLNRHANQLAHHLRTLGVGPETLVGIYVERSLEMVIGLLAILKAGGAYLPLDPGYPAERIAFMLTDASAPVLLTQTHLLATLPPTVAQILCLDDIGPTLTAQPDTNPVSTVQPHHLAYVIYTSGSTGRPKGVLNHHTGLSNLLQHLQAAHGLTPQDCTLQTTAMSFDVATAELFWPLLNGARLVLTRPDGPRDSRALVGMLAAHQVTTLHLVPTLLQVLGDEAGFMNCRSLRRIIVAGEALSAPLYQRMQAHPTARLENWYGPTEATIYVTMWPGQAAAALGVVPIGCPIANTHAYVLDSSLQPLPIGVAGELYIGGIQLARGYLNRPELTAERFITHPEFGRLYKTGDQVRYLPDGNIEFLGRLDHQIKLRGFRIELGEIESTLHQHPTIHDAVVLTRSDDTRGAQLVAYLLVKPIASAEALALPDHAIDREALRQFLHQSLPDYMLPASFVVMSAWPLTPSGKIDRKALPAPDISPVALGQDYTAPRTPTEVQLTALYAEVLGVARVGIHDDFFNLGGHSLLAIRLMRQIQQAFGQALPLAALYTHHTVARLAAALAKPTADDPASSVPVPFEATAPTSYTLAHGQRALWFMQQSAPGSHAYNSGLALRLRGPLDRLALRGALADLVARHPNLRLIVTLEGGAPLQVVQSSGPVLLAEVDARDSELAALVREYFTQPFDLERGVFRATLITYAHDDHVLILSLHHLATDAGSADILTREMAHCYAARRSGLPVTLPPLTHTYADYVRWEHALIDAAGDHLRTYWHAQLSGDLPVLQLPLDAPRPPVQTFNGRAYVWTLGPELTRQLKALARERQVTRFTLLLAVYHVLLHRSTGQHDLLVGTAPEAGRTRPEFADVVGYFVNLVALRSTFDPAAPPTFSAFLSQVAQTVSGALAHQHYPFPLLVQELLPRRDASIPPLIQTLFLLTQREGDDATAANDVTIAPYRVEETGGPGAGQLDLSLLIDDQGETLRLVFDYNADLFAAASVERMAGHFTELLRGIVAQPEQRIDRLPLMTAAERQLLLAWNDTAAPYPDDLCIHQLFEAQVERSPDAVALVFEQQQISYRELNTRANQLAHQLLAKGVGPDRLVGICTERSVALIVGILGVLKAGGAYLPLDPGLPLERLRFMLEDAGVTLLLTQTTLRATMPQVVPLLDLNQDREHEPVANPDVAVRSDNLAYAIYTSGSTGRPKGVLIEHRSLCNLVYGQIDRFSVTATSRVLQFVSFSFDVATGDIFTALSCGATLYLAHSNPLQRLAMLTTELQQQAITHFEVPASVLATLDPQTCPALQTVIVGGEVCSPEVIHRWSQGRDLFNAYGPTEATICTTTAKLSADPHAQPPPIGYPLPNTQVFILDTQMQPVPVGVPGELYIGGSGLARGYLNRPDLTAERFVPNPFGTGRLYKTGDRCAYRPDGALVFLGRLDQQIKLRGFRIELGEIEAVVCQYPAVQEAVVNVWEDALGEQRLVAYVVTAQAETASLSAELRTFLSERLPQFMIPAAFVGLDALPLNRNGKVDRQALPAPTAHRQSETQYVAPQNERERQLIALWQTVLHLDHVGVHDNFFELGGHSLLLIQLHRRLQDTHGQQVTVMDLFRYPTVATLAAHLSRSHSTVSNGQPDAALDRLEVRRTQRTTGQRQRQLRQQVRREEGHNE